MNYKEDVAKALLDIEAVRFLDEPVTFKSGMKAPVYTDNRIFPSHPEQWKIVIQGFEALIKEKDIQFDFIAGVEAAGIPHSSGLGFYMNEPSVFVRKKAKEHGTKKMVEGGEVEGKKLLLVEDLVSTGGSSLAALEAIREAGGVIDTCLAIVSYEFPEIAENYKKAESTLYTLTNFDTILAEAIAREVVSEYKAAEVKEWTQDPWAWTKKHE